MLGYAVTNTHTLFAVVVSFDGYQHRELSMFVVCASLHFYHSCCGAKSVKLFIYCPNWEELRRFLFVLSIWTVTQSVMFAVFTDCLRLMRGQ